MSDSLKIVGGLISPDLLVRVFAGDAQLPGTSPESYGLERGESVRRQASKLWPYLLETWQAGNQDERKRDRFVRILMRELGFQQPAPAHIAFRATGWDVDLDHRTPNREARAPHSVMQEALNTDDSRLWGILTNGTTFRLLRDSASLVSAQYLEFNLQAVFDGELFAEFVQFYLVCHATRFAVHGDGGGGDGAPESCYLEHWRTASAAQGERALEQLRKGVETAIAVLGTGFIAHPANPQLRYRLDSNELRLDDLNRALLRLVYRVLFWFVAEDRNALLAPLPRGENVSATLLARGGDPPEPPAGLASVREARDRYATYFSSSHLRTLARKQRGTRHADLYAAVTLVFDALGSEGGVPDLAIPGIGGIFETGALDEPLAGARLTNEALLNAIRALALVRSRDGGTLRRVDFGNLGAEELGSVYESLLELIPHYDQDKREYTLTVLPGNERKESGSYYTPTSLVECLLDSALDPLLDEATAKGSSAEKVAALLDLTVCDPACGSGHFLVAAARRIAKRIAAEETAEAEPPESEIRKALRKVVGRCIYGVDINPMAAELAKVSLWVEALEPGKPLSYLDQNIRVGNSLLGVTPALLAEGLPDAAFTAIEGDDKKVCSALRKQNAAERQGQHDLFSQSGIPVTNAVLAKRADSIAHTLPDSLEDLHIHQQRQAEALAASAERRTQKLLADAWCAAFVQPKTDETRTTAITQAVIENFAAEDRTLDLAAAEKLVADLTREYRFFHWHVEFPHIFRVGNGGPIDPKTGWSGGFTCVIGNPPWDQVQLDPQEFFASRSPEIANAANMAARNRMIAKLPEDTPALYTEYKREKRLNDALKYFVHESGQFPLTSYGRLNTYSLFAETSRTVIAATGRSGLVLPTGIATDSFNQHFFSSLVRNGKIVHLYGFRNNRGLFKDVGHGDVRFCLFTFAGSAARISEAQFAFDLGLPDEVKDHSYVYALKPQEIALVNPNTGTCPAFKTSRDARITISIYNRIPALWREVPEENIWELSFQLMFMMSADSTVFQDSVELDALPLYEAKMISHFDHRFGDYRDRQKERVDFVLPRTTLTQKNDPEFSVQPRYWVSQEEVDKRLTRRSWARGWLLGWRDIARNSDERTLICSALPRSGVGHTLPLIFSNSPYLAGLIANFNSFILDYVARQKIAGTHLTFGYVRQFPVLPPNTYHDDCLRSFIESRVLELTYTAWDMEPFARDLGDVGPPFRWDEHRRFQMRAELDALYFHLYGIPRDDVDYIMETFPIVKRKDIAAHGTYRTKEAILEIYDRMATANVAAQPCQTQLTPSPGDGPRHPALRRLHHERTEDTPTHDPGQP